MRCARNTADLVRHGFEIGDFVAIDPQPEFQPDGFINSRHLDDKAGVAVLFGAAKAVRDAGVTLPVDCHLLLTISEEVGVGRVASVLHGDVAEMVSIDNGTPAPGPEQPRVRRHHRDGGQHRAVRLPPDA